MKLLVKVIIQKIFILIILKVLYDILKIRIQTNQYVGNRDSICQYTGDQDRKYPQIP